MAPSSRRSGLPPSIQVFSCYAIAFAAPYMVRRLAFPAPPPQWYGLVRGGGGWAGVCGEGWPLELQLEKRPGVTDQASIVRKPYASHKSYNVAQ